MTEREHTLTIDGAKGTAKCSVTITGYGDDPAASHLANRVRELVEQEWPADRISEL